jgi:hypothetical protein
VSSALAKLRLYSRVTLVPSKWQHVLQAPLVRAEAPSERV